MTFEEGEESPGDRDGRAEIYEIYDLDGKKKRFTHNNGYIAKAGTWYQIME